MKLGQLEGMEELTGSIEALSGDGTVQVEYLNLDKQSRKKVAKAVCTGIITRDIQNLFICDMAIVAADKETFFKGQSNWVKTEKGFSLAANRPNPNRFKCYFDTLIHIEEFDYVVHIELGNVEFEIDGRYVYASDSNTISLRNVRATLYPTGCYTAKLIEE